MEILGAVAGCISIGSELIRLGRAIQKAIKRIKDSRRDIEELATETIIFAGLYERFRSACDDDPYAYTNDASAVRPLISWAQKTIDGLKELLNGVKALQPQSKIRHEWEEKIIARLVWYTSASRVKVLLASLRVARESINGFSNLMYLEALRNKVKILREALRNPSARQKLGGDLRNIDTLEAKIEELRLKISDVEVVHQENKSTLNRAKDDIIVCQEKNGTSNDTIEADVLTELTESLEEYAREVLPRRARRTRPDSSTSSSSTSVKTPTFNHRSTAAFATNFETRPGPRSHNHRSEEKISFTAGTTTRNSSPSLAVASTPTSEVSSASGKATPLSSSHRGMLARNLGADFPSVGPYSRGKEYANDPKGNILSPPIVRSDTRPPHRMTLGRHTIILDPSSFRFNHHEFTLKSHRDYATAFQFYTALKDHVDKLDELEEVLCNRYEFGPGSKWSEIPGWDITPYTLGLLPSAFRIDTSSDAFTT